MAAGRQQKSTRRDLIFSERKECMRGVTLASAGEQMPGNEAAENMIKAVSGDMGRVTAVTGLCFLLTSTAYLAWAYHMMELVKAPVSDAVTLVAAYLLVRADGAQRRRAARVVKAQEL